MIQPNVIPDTKFSHGFLQKIKHFLNLWNQSLTEGGLSRSFE